ncbi:MAG: EVE domain-containing protein [Planctomycetota bacterium]
MTTWLLKTEPDDYSYADLVRDRREPWDGVKNPTAQMHMRQIKKGDEAFIYHTGKERAVVGLARVVKGAYEDPEHAGERTAAGDIKFVLIDIAPVTRAMTEVTLAEIKADKAFEGFDLIRLSRLSVMPVPAKLDARLRKMAGL